MTRLKSIELKSFARRPHVSAKYTLQGFDVVVLSHELPYFVMMSYERYRDIESALKSSKHPYAKTFDETPIGFAPVPESEPVQVLTPVTPLPTPAPQTIRQGWPGADPDDAEVHRTKKSATPKAPPLVEPPLEPPSEPENGKIW